MTPQQALIQVEATQANPRTARKQKRQQRQLKTVKHEVKAQNRKQWR